MHLSSVLAFTVIAAATPSTHSTFSTRYESDTLGRPLYTTLALPRPIESSKISAVAISPTTTALASLCDEPTLLAPMCKAITTSAPSCTVSSSEPVESALATWAEKAITVLETIRLVQITSYDVDNGSYYEDSEDMEGQSWEKWTEEALEYLTTVRDELEQASIPCEEDGSEVQSYDKRTAPTSTYSSEYDSPDSDSLDDHSADAYEYPGSVLPPTRLVQGWVKDILFILNSAQLVREEGDYYDVADIFMKETLVSLKAYVAKEIKWQSSSG